MKSKRVNVWIRIRPTQKFSNQLIQIHEDNKSISIHTSKNPKKGIVNNQANNWSFKTDGILHNAAQDEVYERVASELMNDGLEGYNGTIMCYGQTGSGKTFTMTGATESFNNRGIVPRALSHLYRTIEQNPHSSVTVRVSYIEIYNEQIHDLLSPMSDNSETASSPIVVAEDEKGVYVKGLNCYLAQNEEEALNYLFEGETNRTTAAHTLNQRSSRSHCIFTVYLEVRSRLLSNAKFCLSKVHFVDLAGSERLQKTQSAGKIQQEASYINKSLSFLEQTVMAMADKNRDHVPYRQSKLTHYLKDSIGGSCKTILIANIWGEKEQIEETISTLRFGSRMMRVPSEPIENIQYDPSVLVLNLRKEIEALKRELAMHDTLNNRIHVNYDAISEQMKFELRQQVKKYVDGTLEELDIINVRQIQCVYEIFREMVRNADKEATDRLKSQISETQVTAPSQQKSTAKSKEKSREDDIESVGDVDGKSFGAGHAPKGTLDESGAYLQNKRRDRGKQATGSPSKTGDQSSVVDSMGLNRDMSELDEAKPDDDSAAVPPTRQEAFEEFKNDIGIEIYKILMENRDILKVKKQEYSRLAHTINSTKTEIDRSKLTLESMKSEREVQGPKFTPEGEIIITEAEYLEINRLKELKTSYKVDYEELKNLKSQIFYCQKMVELTRQRLLDEFDRWYTESYLDAEKTQNSIDALKKLSYGSPNKSDPYVDSGEYYDPLERFDEVKHQYFAPIKDAEPYNRAKEEVYYRQVYQAAHNQPQPLRRKPGTPVVNLRERPPNAMEIQY